MLSTIISWSTAAFGGAPFRLNKCTALTSAATGAAGGSFAGGVGGSKVGEWLGGKFGEKGKYQSQKFNGFGSDVDSYIKEASTRYGMDEKTLRGFVKMEAGWNGQMSPTGTIVTGKQIGRAHV